MEHAQEDASAHAGETAPDGRAQPDAGHSLSTASLSGMDGINSNNNTHDITAEDHCPGGEGSGANGGAAYGDGGEAGDGARASRRRRQRVTSAEELAQQGAFNLRTVRASWIDGMLRLREAIQRNAAEQDARVAALIAETKLAAENQKPAEQVTAKSSQDGPAERSGEQAGTSRETAAAHESAEPPSRVASSAAQSVVESTGPRIAPAEFRENNEETRLHAERLRDEASISEDEQVEPPRGAKRRQSGTVEEDGAAAGSSRAGNSASSASETDSTGGVADSSVAISGASIDRDDRGPQVSTPKRGTPAASPPFGQKAGTAEARRAISNGAAPPATDPASPPKKKPRRRSGGGSTRRKKTVAVAATNTIRSQPCAVFSVCRTDVRMLMLRDVFVLGRKGTRGLDVDLDLTAAPKSNLISKQHAIAYFDGNDYFLLNYSKNGTEVDGELYVESPAPLFDGSLIRVGRVLLIFNLLCLPDMTVPWHTSSHDNIKDNTVGTVLEFDSANGIDAGDCMVIANDVRIPLEAADALSAVAMAKLRKRKLDLDCAADMDMDEESTPTRKGPSTWQVSDDNALPESSKSCTQRREEDGSAPALEEGIVRIEHRNSDNDDPHEVPSVILDVDDMTGSVSLSINVQGSTLST